jgi:hypothetical protein
VRGLVVRRRRHRQIDQVRGERELARLELSQCALDNATEAACEIRDCAARAQA